MADVLFLAVLVAFFAFASGFVWACNRLMGSDHPG